MKKLAGLFLSLVVVGLAVFWLLTRPASLSSETRAALVAHEADPSRGEAVFWTAGCASCHARPGLESNAPTEDRLVLMGGHRFATPFGTFYAPNISMDPTHGIGAWTLEEFANAVWNGVSPSGQHYYPAFPYTTYTRAGLEDIADLWAFWQTLPADATPSQPHDVSFPFSFRRGLGLWKIVNLTTHYPTPEFAELQLARGRYLVEALGHCAECHTPRDVTGGLDMSAWMTGAPILGAQGRVPALPPEGWSTMDIAAYLQSGFTPSFDVVGGAMADVVANMSRISDDDRNAIAAYIHALRSSPNR